MTICPPNAPVGPSLSLDPRSYLDPEIFRREMSKVFEHHWIFVGFTRQLANHNDFVMQKIGGVTVVVQNFHGELRALHNVCSHRSAMIRTAPSGHGPLQCPYHGWTYNQDGVPVGIPGNKEFFCFDDAQKNRRALRRFDLATCGIFIFVRVEPGAQDLRDFLGPHWDLLEHLSQHFGAQAPIEDVSLPWETNWKLGMESVLEVYHVDTIHPDTFKRLVKSFWHFEAAGLHSSARSILREDMKGWWDKAIPRLGLHKSPRLDEYDHFVIFPNVAIGVTRGSLMSVQTYEPRSPTSCSLHYRMVLANSSRPDTVGRPVWRAVAGTVLEFNRTLLDEDRVAAEGVQRGLTEAHHRAILGANEGRIRLFHEALHQFVEYPT
jgi:phenylpropionate dioxygenase-like ring-hydroxylating dioxygenase large terminal subunit